jgi:hypothetical protein
MSPPTDQLTYAVMQDDTVLCADCVAEICDDRQPSAATMVHAWLASQPGDSCSCCGADSEPIADAR